ncbi:hypothetical protein FLP10_07885 [Agromyces intestinalis]|uniref:Alpha/beta hydrolase n=1 Tax=Agromyces intestinalis TaxID=2592652 RepID=A0A5C1YH31_9MICO|nr:hypothetical protein [Agromyces intestinalis]QEO14347.1 hypothetical protein FLP10_07885 [Agromyces intestinalis]
MAQNRWFRAGVWIADYCWAGAAQLATPFAGRPPRRWLHGDDGLPEVIVVPGVYERWSFLRGVGERMHRAGHRVRVLHGLGINRAPIGDTGEKLTRALARMPRPAAGRIVVGHSKGGLIGKYLLIREADGNAGDLGLLGVVAIAAPFAGTRRARLLRGDPGVREFLPDAPIILTLGEASTVNGRIVSIFGPYDPHIPDGSELPGATNILVPRSGHFRVLGARETADAVLQGLVLLRESASA